MNFNSTVTGAIQGSLLLRLALLLLWVCVFGCGENAKKPGDPRVLHFYSWRSDQPQVWDEIVRTFEAEHPGVQVRREIGPNSSTALHDLLTQKLRNRSPDLDVFFMDVVWPAEFAEAGWALPLDDYFPGSERALFLKNTIQAGSYKGKVFGVPLFVDSGLLYFRKDLLEKYGFQPPATWSEMVRQAEVISAGESGSASEIRMYGYSAQFKQYEGLVCNMLEYIAGNRGFLVNPEDGRPGISGQSAVEAVRFVRDHVIGKTAPRGVLTYEEPESLALFVQGRAVFHRNWPHAWAVSNNPGLSRVAGRVGISRLPRFPGGESHAALGGWQLGISAYSEKKELAWAFVRFVTSERIQKVISMKTGLAPTRIGLYEDEDVLRASPQFREMKKVFLSAVPRPVSPLYPALSDIMQRYFSRAISDPRADIPGEARTAAAEMEKILAIVP